MLNLTSLAETPSVNNESVDKASTLLCSLVKRCVYALQGVDIHSVDNLRWLYTGDLLGKYSV